jgi:membrane associated rhomboid family serine protease
MTWLDKLERRFGFLGIPGLMRILVGFTALVFVLIWLNPDFRFLLKLDPVRILRGEVWRLITYIFLPQTYSPLWLVLALWFLWFVGEGLEQAMGPFRVTIYFFLGMIGTTVAAFFFGSNFSNAMLISSLFFAFARFYPDQVIYILFILPAKIKWIAWALALFLLLGFVLNTNSYRAALLAAFANYFIFFGPEILRAARHRKEVSSRRKRFEGDARASEALHHCAICGATELSDPHLEFRVARNGEEYCMPHLSRAQTAAPA